MIAGDSQAESQFSAVKRIMRKQNTLGRTYPREVDSVVLSTQRLREHPGLMTVVQALAAYGQARVKALGHGPRDFLTSETNTAWLKLQNIDSAVPEPPACARNHSDSANLKIFLEFFPFPGSLLKSPPNARSATGF